MITSEDVLSRLRGSDLVRDAVGDSHALRLNGAGHQSNPNTSVFPGAEAHTSADDAASQGAWSAWEEASSPQERHGFNNGRAYDSLGGRVETFSKTGSRDRFSQSVSYALPPLDTDAWGQLPPQQLFDPFATIQDDDPEWGGEGGGTAAGSYEGLEGNEGVKSYEGRHEGVENYEEAYSGERGHSGEGEYLREGGYSYSAEGGYLREEESSWRSEGEEASMVIFDPLQTIHDDDAFSYGPMSKGPETRDLGCEPLGAGLESERLGYEPLVDLGYGPPRDLIYGPLGAHVYGQLGEGFESGDVGYGPLGDEAGSDVLSIQSFNGVRTDDCLYPRGSEGITDKHDLGAASDFSLPQIDTELDWASDDASTAHSLVGRSVAAQSVARLSDVNRERTWNDVELAGSRLGQTFAEAMLSSDDRDSSGDWKVHEYSLGQASSSIKLDAAAITSDGIQQILDDKRQTFDTRQQTIDEKEQTFDHRQQTFGDKQQTFEHKQQPSDVKRLPCDEKALSHDSSEQPDGNRRPLKDNRRQASDDKGQANNSGGQHPPAAPRRHPSTDSSTSSEYDSSYGAAAMPLEPFEEGGPCPGEMGTAPPGGRGGAAWPLLLRVPVQKRLMGGARAWRAVRVRLVEPSSGRYALRVYADRGESELMLDLPLHPALRLYDEGLQQVDERSKCCVLTLQRVLYTDALSVRGGCSYPPSLPAMPRLRDLASPLSSLRRLVGGVVGGVAPPRVAMERRARLTEQLKFGALSPSIVLQVRRAVEDALFRGRTSRSRRTPQPPGQAPLTPLAPAGRRREELRVELVDEVRMELDGGGEVTRHKVRVRLYLTAFLCAPTSSTPRGSATAPRMDGAVAPRGSVLAPPAPPLLDIGLNDERRRGREVVARRDILPLSTEDWVGLEAPELCPALSRRLWDQRGVLRVTPLHGVRQELARFRVRLPSDVTLPLRLVAHLHVGASHARLRSELRVPACFAVGPRRVAPSPCRDIEVHYPLPAAWTQLFRPDRLSRYGSGGSLGPPLLLPGGLQERLSEWGGVRTGRGGVERAQVEVSTGAARYEALHGAVVWRVDLLPARDEDVYKPHVLILRLDLDPKDALPRDLHRPIRVTFHVPDSTASRTQVRSLSPLFPAGGDEVQSSPPPLRSVQHVTHYEYSVEMNVSTAVSARGARGGHTAGGQGGRWPPCSPAGPLGEGKGLSPPVKSSSSYSSSDSNLSSLESDDEGEYMIKGKDEGLAGVKGVTGIKADSGVKDVTGIKVKGGVKVIDDIRVRDDSKVKVKDDSKLKVKEDSEEKDDDLDGGVASDRTSSEYD